MCFKHPWTSAAVLANPRFAHTALRRLPFGPSFDTLGSFYGREVASAFDIWGVQIWTWSPYAVVAKLPPWTSESLCIATGNSDGFILVIVV